MLVLCCIKHYYAPLRALKVNDLGNNSDLQNYDFVLNQQDHRHGKWGAGGEAAPLEIFCPPRLLSWAIFGTKNVPEKTLFSWFWVKNTPCPVKTFFFRDRWILGQKHTLNPVMTFFFRERWFLGQKAIQFQRRTVFRVEGLALWILPPPPCLEIVPTHWARSHGLVNLIFDLKNYIFR